jgi:hypothetical protein
MRNLISIDVNLSDKTTSLCITLKIMDNSSNVIGNAHTFVIIKFFFSSDRYACLFRVRKVR